ncbi:MAG: hydroxyacylglutathione hydrolase [Burkholderiales bacterium]
MNLIALPAFTDNYIWMLHDGRRAIVVDPGDAAPVLQALASEQLTLVGILVTHHHQDHTAGLSGLRSVSKGPVWGPARESIASPVVPVGEGDTLSLLGHAWTVLDIPGHTSGHVAYFSELGGEPVVFCGDTLFSAGCGRLFEGTPEQMWASLKRLAALPSDTRLCCGHEYTLANLAFAQAVEPDNQDVAEHMVWCQKTREQQLPTLPSSVERELRINPFLRVHVAGVIQQALQHGAQGTDGVQVFAALRQWKNMF